MYKRVLRYATKRNSKPVIHKLSFFLAKRYIFKKAYNNSISTMTTVCLFALFISSFALTLVMAVMNGFEKETYKKLQGIHAQIIIRGFGKELDYASIAKVLSKEFPEIAHSAPHTTRHGIIQNNSIDSDEPYIVLLIGVNPSVERLVTTLEEKVTGNNQSIIAKQLPELIFDNTIIMGENAAKAIGIKSLEKCNLLFSESYSNTQSKITFNSTELQLAGTFKTGIDEFDTSVIFCSLDFLQNLFPNTGVEQINISLLKGTDELAVIQKLRDRLNLEVYSWKDLYPALVSALSLEKYIAFIVLTLIILVASMNIISLLFMQILEKRSDIAILKAMGATNNTIRWIFIYMGMGIALCASSCGIIFALCISCLLQKFPLIKLPDAYYVSYLPATIEPQMIALVFCVILVISYLAAIISLKNLASINIAHVLRFE